MWKAPAHQDAFRFVRSLAARHARTFYLAAHLFPEEVRWATYAVYGYCRYADNLVDIPRQRTREELLDELEGLRKETSVAYRTGESQHPVVGPFILVARTYGIPPEYPLALLDGVAMDLNQTRYATFDELYTFAYRVAGVVGLMMTHVIGYTDPRALAYAEKLGIAMQLTNILRDVQEDARMGRIYLPLEELHASGLSETDILQERWSPRLQRLMAFQVERARTYYREALPGVAYLHPRGRLAVRAAAQLYGGILDKIEARAYHPFLGRAYLTRREKLQRLVRLWLKHPGSSFGRAHLMAEHQPNPLKYS